MEKMKDELQMSEVQGVDVHEKDTEGEVKGIDMLKLQAEVPCDEAVGASIPRRLSWDEMERILLRIRNNKAVKKYQRKHRSRFKATQRRCWERKNLKDMLRRRKDNRNNLIAKKKFWVVSPKKP